MDSIDERQLPVAEADNLVGILTRTDTEPFRGHLEWTPVGRAMSAQVVVATPETALTEVIRLLLEGRFNSLPVVDGGRLVGMITVRDLVGLLAQYM